MDVWDAFTSRPYRLAWSREKAIKYIREQSGKYFDPTIVRLFLPIIEAGNGTGSLPGSESFSNPSLLFFSITFSGI